VLDSFRKGQRWLTLIFVGVIGLVFVFFLGVGGSFGPTTPTGNTIIELDDVRLTSRDLARERANLENRLRDQLGDEYDRAGASRFLDSQAFATLLNSVVLEAAAKDMGLRVTKDELRRVVQKSPAFSDEDGRFSTKAFERFAEYEYGSQRAFIRSFTRGLLGQKLVSLLVDQTEVTDAELDLRTRYELEEVRLAYVALDTTTLPPDQPLDEAAIEAWAKEHEEELRSAWQARQVASGSADAEATEPERIHARHILVRVDEDASEKEIEAAREQAEDARERVLGGEDFESVVAEVSDDPATAAQGGDLGVIERGSNDPAFDQAAFALEPGGVSDVVRSSRGFHVIRVDERFAPEAETFESQRLELAREGAVRAAAAKRARVVADALVEAIESGQSLEEAAREQGLGVQRTAALKRRPDGLVPGLGAAEQLLTTAFTLEAGESSPRPFEVGSRIVLIQVIEHDEPDRETIVAARSTRREQALAEKQNRLLQTWINDYRLALEASGRLRVNAEVALGS
jgi:peptidyl-prolyl cis-trans isomerase D